jgi:uncharacterized protein
VFNTAPFKSPFAIVGAPLVTLNVAATTPDADVHAVLLKVAPNGEATYLTDGLMRASHRVLGAAPYDNLGLPFSDSRRATIASTPPLRTDQPATLVFDMQPIGVHLQKGDRLRLVITGADAETNLTIPQTPPTQLSIRTGAPAASTLTVDRVR